MSSINELHLNISNSTCPYLYNFSVFTRQKKPKQSVVTGGLCPKEIENGEFRGKTLEVPEVPSFHKG